MRSLFLLSVVACTSGGSDSAPPPEADTDTDADADSDTDADTDSDSDTDTDVATVGFVVHPSMPLIEVGSAVQLRGHALLADGSSTVVTSSVDWTDPLSSVGTLTPGGLFTAGEVGQVRATASHTAETLAIQIRTHAASTAVTEVSLSPANAQVAVGSPILFSAPAELADGTTGDLVARCSWSSSNPDVLAIGPDGAAIALLEGSATVDADCAGFDRSAQVTVGASPPPPDIAVTAYSTSHRGGGVFDHRATLTNNGGYARPFVVDFVADSPTDPGAPTERISVPGLATGEAIVVSVEHTYTGPRPATLTSWVTADGAGVLGDSAPANNVLSTQTVLEADVVSDIRVEFGGITVFGPTDAGVIFEIFNDGPADVTDLEVFFERDAPLATGLVDLDPASSERSVLIPSLASGESYLWLFDYDQVPFGSPWTSCGFVPVDGFADPDTADNLACGDFPAY